MTDLPGEEDVTQILSAVDRGDEAAIDRLFPLIYDEMHRMAGRFLGHERPDHTLQPTALVHEAYLKLVDQRRASWNDSRHFFAVAAMAMRRILVNHAKSRGRLKRGGDRARLALDEGDAIVHDAHVDLIAIDDALNRLAEIDPDQARTVELRFFGGLTVDETARVLGVSPRTVQYDWAMARAWLRGELGRDEDGDGS